MACITRSSFRDVRSSMLLDELVSFSMNRCAIFYARDCMPYLFPVQWLSITFVNHEWCSVAATVFLWIGSIIPSLWANIYEAIFQILLSSPPPSPTSLSSSSSLSLSSSPPPSSSPSPSRSEDWEMLHTRIVVLSLFSAVHTVLAVFVTSSLIRLVWRQLCIWAREGDMQHFAYNSLHDEMLVNKDARVILEMIFVRVSCLSDGRTALMVSCEQCECKCSDRIVFY